MADRTEDLIGHYLADLFEAPGNSVSNAAEAVSLENKLASDPNPVIAPLKPELPPDSIIPRPVIVEVAAQQLKPVPQADLAPILDQPARQQLQQLLDSAWQTKAVTEVAPIAHVAAITIEEHPAAPLKLEAPAVTVAPSAVAAIYSVSGKPAWAEKTFDSLIIEVAGLKLAIPLIVLGQIFPVSAGFTHLPGQGPLFLGTLHTARGTLRVINTALLVMPERYDAEFIHSVRFVVSLVGAEPDAPWQLALGVNKVAQPVSLACNDVLWRGERSKRPWLLGTVKSQMCALLDVAVIGQMFHAGS